MTGRDRAAAGLRLGADPDIRPDRFHRCPTDPDCPHCGRRQREGEAFDWSFLDRVFCICLRTREDRMRHASAQFHRVGLCRHVLFYRPDRHPEKGIIGSWEAHRSVAMRALAEGAGRVLIFEDDVLFNRRVTPRTLRAIAAALDSLPEGWMLFYLGHWPLRAWFLRPGVLRTSSGCAHAYIASRRLLEWLRDHPWGTPGIDRHPLVGRALDSAYAMLPGTYALFPMIATQAVSPSDNFTAAQKRRRKNKWRLRHLVTHSRHREWLLSHLMRPAELTVLLLAPLLMIAEIFRPRLFRR